ncbi:MULTISPECIES: hypothetical protein [unclassified Salinibacterium]|uniref:hypothetical protein n=1 Tax=unclassified Salinibacterium TaxID=2632331 RepID=UPI0018CCC748|nr:MULTISPECIES: hypothetical protein [unclassified Salinibacterium]MBH0053764.1 hypothetical protein [Salinibacterium sp. SWN139]MBH0083038.1 hypothetical protein [Salinibacterium sp. SWN167]
MRSCEVALIGIAVVFGLAGCVSAEPHAAESSGQSGESGVVTEGSKWEMPLLSADSNFLNPDSPYSVLFEQVDSGSHEYSLPPLGDSVDQLFLAIGCDRSTPYEVALVSGETVVDSTWASNCASERGTPASTYLTSSLEGDLSTLTLRVTVDDGARFSVSVFEAASAAD